MSELAERLRVDASTATRAVDRLVRAGLATRRRDPDDARGVRVAATPAGRARLEEVVRRRRTALRAILADFDDDDRRRLAELLERLVAGVDAFARRRP
jgi:DNA-binding MarR family transcriptional regulator